MDKGIRCIPRGKSAVPFAVARATMRQRLMLAARIFFMPRFSATLMDHFQNPRHQGRLERPDRVGQVGSAEAPPWLVMHLALDGERLTEARFQTFGCGVTIAAASCLLDLAVGRTVDECAQITATDICAALDGVPQDKAWCVNLALDALRAGLNLQNPAENTRADFSKDS